MSNPYEPTKQLMDDATEYANREDVARDKRDKRAAMSDFAPAGETSLHDWLSQTAPQTSKETPR